MWWTTRRIKTKSENQPRQGWAEACQKMAKRGDDRLLDDVSPSLTSFDETEWEWEATKKQ
jgi:hypothetical protein